MTTTTMTTSRIIFQNESGGVSVIIPTGKLPIEDIAQKDVPAGVPYLIVDAIDVPDDRTFRNAWEADFSNPDGHGLGADAYFAAKAAEEAAVAEQTVDVATEEANQ
jgi:hypothetical protein